jgi:hypothetical protein
MAARKGKGSWEHADVPALTLKECEGTPCRGRVLLRVRRRRRRLLSLLFLTPFLPSFPPSLLCPFLSFSGSLTLFTQTIVLMGCMRLPSLSLHGIEGPCPGEAGERMFSIRWVFFAGFYCLSLVRVGVGGRGKREVRDGEALGSWPLVVRVVWMGGEVDAPARSGPRPRRRRRRGEGLVLGAGCVSCEDAGRGVSETRAGMTEEEETRVETTEETPVGREWSETRRGGWAWCVRRACVRACRAKRREGGEDRHVGAGAG